MYIKNLHMILVKSAPKKSFAQKADFFRTFSIGNIVFWLKLFTKSYVHFWNQYGMKRRIFDISFDQL